MESSYTIGPFEVRDLHLSSSHRLYYDPDYTKPYIIDHDWGYFETYVSRLLDDYLIKSNLPEFGWTLLADKQLMLDLVNGYNNSKDCRGELFKDIDTLPASKVYYIRWIDWS